MRGADHEVLDRLDGYDPERGVKVVGHRGYFLRKWGVFLNQCVFSGQTNGVEIDLTTPTGP